MSDLPDGSEDDCAGPGPGAQAGHWLAADDLKCLAHPCDTEIVQRRGHVLVPDGRSRAFVYRKLNTLALDPGGGHSDIMPFGERRKDSRYLDAAHSEGMPLSMAQNEILYSVKAALLGAATVRIRAKNAMNLIGKR